MRLPSFLYPTYLSSLFTLSLLIHLFYFTFTALTPLHTHLCLTLTFLLSFTISLLPLVMMEEWMKVHTNGRVQHEASKDIDGDYFYSKAWSAGVIKILEPMNPLLNYYEYLIVNRGQKALGPALIGIGVRMPLNSTTSSLHTFDTVGIVLM